MSGPDERQEHLLRAAADVIVRLGYDKTTMSDIAAAAGVSRGTVYLYFKSKDDLFEALLSWEFLQYARIWLEALEADPRGGTMGGYYRAAFHAMSRRPLMGSIIRRDLRVLGNYLRKPGNVFAAFESGSATTDLIRALQTAGAVRPDLDPAVVAYIVESISYGQLTLVDFRSADQFPPLPEVLEELAEMMDRWLLPPGGGKSEAGKNVFRQVARAGMEQFEQRKLARSGTTE